MIYSLNFFATGAHFSQNGVDATLVDGTHGGAGEAQTHKALFTFDPEAVGVKIGQETATRLVVRVRYGVPGGRALTRNLAYS